MPFPVPSASGLAMTGNGNWQRSTSANSATTCQSGVGTPAARTTVFVSALSRHTAITAGSENVYGMSYTSRIAGTCDFARPAVQSLADVEHEVPAVALRQSLDEISRVADAIGRVAELLKRAVDRFDRADLIEFGSFFFAVAGGEVVDAKIVSEDRCACSVCSWPL